MTVEALLTRVRAHPDDDDLRRVLGDALTDAGDPLGTLIARETGSWNSDERLIAHAALLPRIAGDLFGHVEPVAFRLGFLEEVRDLGTAPLHSPTWATVRALETDRPELLAQLPHVERLVTRLDTVCDLLAAPEPVSVRRLWPVEVDVPAPLDGLPDTPGAWANVTHLALTTTSDEPRPQLYAVASALLGCGLPLQVLRVETREPPPAYLRRRFAELGGQRLEWRGEALQVHRSRSASFGRSSELEAASHRPRALDIATGPPVAHDPPVPLPAGIAARVVGRHSTGRYVARGDQGPVLWQWPVPDNLLRAPGSGPPAETIHFGRRRRVGVSVVNEVRALAGPGAAPWTAAVREAAKRAVLGARRRVPPRYRLAETALEAFALDHEEGRLLTPRVHPRADPDRVLDRLELRGESTAAWAGITVPSRSAVDALSCYGAHSDGIYVVAEGLGGRPRAELAATVVACALATPGPVEDRFDDAKQRLVPIADPRAPEWSLGVSAVRLSLSPATATVAWLGDVGVLHLRGESRVRIARGHPDIERWIEEGRMTARGTWSPYAVQVTRSLTPGDQGRLLAPRVDELDVEPGDRFVMMTSGVSRVLDDPTLHGIARAHATTGPRSLAGALADVFGRLTRDESASVMVVDIG